MSVIKMSRGLTPFDVDLDVKYDCVLFQGKPLVYQVEDLDFTLFLEMGKGFKWDTARVYIRPNVVFNIYISLT